MTFTIFPQFHASKTANMQGADPNRSKIGGTIERNCRFRESRLPLSLTTTRPRTVRAYSMD